jgi:tetratricopeptide (TPR) repeat protein
MSEFFKEPAGEGEAAADCLLANQLAFAERLPTATDRLLAFTDALGKSKSSSASQRAVAEARLYRAATWLQKKKFEEALDDALLALHWGLNGEAACQGHVVCAKAFEALGEWNACLKHAKAALKIQGSGDAWILQARAERHLGKAKEAQVSASRALGIQPGSPEALVERGCASMDLRQWESAAADFDAASQAEGTEAGRDALVLWGEVLLLSGDWDEGKSHLQRAIGQGHPSAIAVYAEHFPLQSAREFWLYGEYCLASGEAQRALQSYLLAYKLGFEGGQSSALFLRLGEANSLLAQHISAHHWYSKCIEASPKDAWAFALRGRASAAMARWEEAASDFDAAVALNSTLAEAYLYRASSRRRLGLWHSALSDCDRTVALAPDSPDAHFERAELLCARGEWVRAKQDYLVAERLGHPDAARVRRARLGNETPEDFSAACDAHLESKEAACAESCATHAMALLSDKLNVSEDGAHRRMSTLLAKRSAARAMQKSFSAAVADAKQAIHFWPESLAAHLALGSCLLEAGKLSAARRAFDACVALSPFESEGYFGRGRTYLVLGQFVRAIWELGHALRHGFSGSVARQAAALELRAEAYRELGRRAEAEKDVRAARDLRRQPNVLLNPPRKLRPLTE